LTIAASAAVPAAVRRPPNHNIRLSATPIITRNRPIRCETESDRDERPIRRIKAIPNAVRWAEDADVRLAVTVEVAEQRQVTVQAEANDVERVIRTVHPIPPAF